MADRTLEQEWPEYVNSTGVPGTGSKVTAELLDGIKDAVSAAVYDPSLDDDPPSIAREVAGARGAYGSLDARFDAVEALASGGAADVAIPGQVNLVPNGNFLIWGAGVTSVPSLFGSTGGPTFAAVSARGGADANKIVGPYYCNMTSGGAGNKDLYIDLLASGDLSTDGSFPLSGADFAAGILVKTSTTGSVTLIIDDGVSEKTLATNTHSDGTFKWVSGSVQLASTASRLRLIVRLSAVITVGLSGLCAYAASSAPRYIPPPMTVGDIVYSEPGGAVISETKAYWTPSRPIFLESVVASCVSGTGTMVVKKDGASIFGNIAVSNVPATTYASTATLASISESNTLAIDCSVSNSMVLPSVRMKFIAFDNPWPAVRIKVAVS
jgi:hypothetical protein